MKLHFPKLWLFSLVIVFMVMSIMPFMAGSLAKLILTEHSRRIWFSPFFPTVIFFLSSMTVSIIFSVYIGLKILSPIGQISQAAKQVSKGEFTVRVDTRSSLRELKELTENFNRMVQELSSIEALRNDFVTNISHEFKTPLASIEGYATLLQNPALSEQQRNEYTHVIIDSTRQLSTLAGNILNMSRLEKQEIVTDKTSYRLDEQIRQALLILEPLWEKKNLDLDIDLPPVTYYGNTDLLMQVWLNLFQNAIKFTPKAGTISVSIQTHSEYVDVTITDTGVGMDEETKRHVFEKFYCGRKNSGQEGNGLGLSIVKRIVDLCHGTVTVDSRPGEGAVFTVSLPFEERG